MKVLFLDFDGVLNNKQYLMSLRELPEMPGADTLSDADLFCMKREVALNNMWILRYIMKQVPDLQIVISSSWRLHYDIESFKELFKIFNMDGERIIGKTPKKFSSERVHEIHMWLEDYNETHKDEVDFVAVDDHVIFNLEDPDKAREFLTDGWTGITMHDAFKIIKHFKPDFKEPVFYI
jgi:hypothetical protein